MPNTEQAERWDGIAGRHWATEAGRYTRMSRRFEERILGALRPAAGERVLDVGCGNGDVSLALAQSVGPGGEVVGLDLSGPMLARARERAVAAGIANVRFEQGDAQVYGFQPASFDAFVSRFGVMFFDDPGAAFANLARALRPGGRVTFVCWQDLLRNEYVMVPATAALLHVPLPDFGDADQSGPFSLSDAGELRSLLERAGLKEIELESAHEPMWMGTSVDDVVEFFHHHEFAEILFRDVPDDVADLAWQAVAEALEPHVTPDGVVLSGTAWLVTARRD